MDWITSVLTIKFTLTLWTNSYKTISLCASQRPKRDQDNHKAINWDFVATKFPDLPANGALNEPPLDVSNVMD
ncbi:hypothetical protein DSO57_1011910 [Entomophthora muscae]|uniref:Uncharacterized protein n=1 Tax=Entomophthora muscae TaxID=34485 RepID=A0ACC2SJB6_9FUNG|nr:hypothetical protein DSO57_1011910 [Entomophthora muscae]